MISNLNMNYDLNVVIPFSQDLWIDSPKKGVSRIPYERENTESGKVTSLVRYNPGSSFTNHDHPRGEEIFVLEGVFSDEHGDYPAGTYLRNPPGSNHSPFSNEGCLLLVKLDQFQHGDHKKVIVGTSKSSWRPGHGNLQVLPLHEFQGVSTALVKWPEDEKFIPHKHFGGEEIFVLQGEFKDEHGSYPKYCWLRSAHLSVHHPYVEKETIIFVKTGHLLS